VGMLGRGQGEGARPREEKGRQVGCAAGKEINGSMPVWASCRKVESWSSWVGSGENEEMAQGRLEDRKHFLIFKPFLNLQINLNLNQI
jgi:hypothetical protein